jgi:hypothetical protein
MAVVVASFVKRGKVGNEKAKDTLRYIQHRPDKDKERVTRPLFTNDSPMTRLEAYQFVDEAPKGTKFFTIIISPDPATEDTHYDLDMRSIARTNMQTVAEIVQAQGITTPVIWAAAVHDDHTDKNHVHALASVQGRLDKPDLKRLIEVTTQACLEQRRELDRARERQARQREIGEEWEPEPTLEEDRWGD